MKKVLSRKSFVFFICILSLVSACTSKRTKDTVIAKELYRINVGGKYGFINENGDIVIEPQFDKSGFFFNENDVCFAMLGERKGLINANGEFVAELDSEIGFVWSYKNGVARCIGANGKYGIVDKNGGIMLPLVYTDVIRDGTIGFIVQDTLGNMGYVNNRGEFIVPCVYDDVKGFHEGLMVVATNNKCGYVDTLGDWVIDSIYDDARGFRNGIARVKKGNWWVFIDKKGNVIESLKYEEILTGFSDNRVFVKQNGIISLINRQGSVIKQIDVDSVYSFNEGYARFKKNGKFGMLDTNGNVSVAAKYEQLSGYENGLANYKKNNLLGLIDTGGKVVVEATHNFDCGTIDGYVLLWGQDTVNNEFPMTYYDQKGNVIWKDMPGNKFSWPKVPTKEDFVAYFDSKLSELDPIEGIYYVTFNRMAVDRQNDHASSNGSHSKFYAVMRSNENRDELLRML